MKINVNKLRKICFAAELTEILTLSKKLKTNCVKQDNKRKKTLHVKPLKNYL